MVEFVLTFKTLNIFFNFKFILRNMEPEEVNEIVEPLTQHTFFKEDETPANSDQHHVILTTGIFVLRAFFREGRELWIEYQHGTKREKTLTWLIHGMYYNHQKQDSSFALIADQLKKESGYEGNVHAFISSIEPTEHNRYHSLKLPLESFTHVLRETLMNSSETVCFAAITVLQAYFLHFRDKMNLSFNPFSETKKGPHGYRLAAHIFQTPEEFKQILLSKPIEELVTSMNAVLEAAHTMYLHCSDAPHGTGSTHEEQTEH